MEAIREYLANLFMSLPETPEVLRARAALLEMMEDKYDELVSEGKSEKEAVGIVISEFGNLEELAEELGIQVYLDKQKEASAQNSQENAKEQDPETAPGSDGPATGQQKLQKNRLPRQYEWTFREIRDYLKYAWKHAACVAFGVALCIWSPYPASFMDGAAAEGYCPEWAADAIGSTLLFFMVAAAVALFCTASHIRKQYGNIARFGISLDEEAERFVEQKKESDEQKRLWMRVVGIVLCIVSVVPSSFNYFRNAFLQAVMDSSVLLFVGIGVCLIVYSSSVGNRYKELVKAVRNGGGEHRQKWQGSASSRRGGTGLAVFLIIFFVMLSGTSLAIGWLFVPMSGEVRNIDFEKTYDVAGVREVKLDMDWCDVRLEGADTDGIEVKYSGDDRYVPQIINKNGVFRVVESERRGWFGLPFNFLRLGLPSRGREVIVYIPESLFPSAVGSDQADGTIGGLEYSIAMDAGNVVIEGIHTSSLTLDVDAGNVTMEEIRGSSLTLDVDAGNVEGNRCVFYGAGSIDVDAGNVEFQESEFANLEADVDAGGFSFLRSAIPLENYRLDLDVDLGEISINGQKMGSSHQTQATGGAEFRMTVEVDLGDIKISEK